MSREVPALLVVDVQNGFIDRELPVAGGVEVVAVINRLMPRFPVVVASQDWHPSRHGSFASTREGAQPFQMGELEGSPQMLWPDHCVAGTPGAAFHPELEQRYLQCIVRKGMDPKVDSYSAFEDNHGQNPSGLLGYLRERGVTSVYVCGLAFDYCVRYTAEDALRLTPRVFVIEDACRSVALDSEAEAKRVLAEKGIQLISSADVLEGRAGVPAIPAMPAEASPAGR